jgi:hypothetical protein
MKNKNILLITLICLFAFLIVFGGGYTYWNAAGPDKTCVNCHEIRQSVSTMHGSAHREFLCKECHGTALSNGLHSLKEKSNMIFTHVGEDVKHEDIHLTEEQVLELSDKCIKCHQSEYKGWLAGGHAATYEDIYLDTVHNAMEAPYADCLRCHGMFYDGTTADLVEPLSTKGPWRLKDKEKMDDPTVPCLACHQMHSDNEQLTHTTADTLRNPSIALYVRADKMYLRADKLFKTRMFHDGKEVRTSDDVSQRLCVNCHSPNSVHAVGTEDDRTPRGVHEGLSCNACHKAHSNDASGSCVKCHPAISNCKLDVLTMNTTYFDPKSPNNIHFVACADCHKDLMAKK